MIGERRSPLLVLFLFFSSHLFHHQRYVQLLNSICVSSTMKQLGLRRSSREKAAFLISITLQIIFTSYSKAKVRKVKDALLIWVSEEKCNN